MSGKDDRLSGLLEAEERYRNAARKTKKAALIVGWGSVVLAFLLEDKTIFLWPFVASTALYVRSGIEDLRADLWQEKYQSALFASEARSILYHLENKSSK